jgi:RING-H2 zinc finger domain
VHLLVGFPREKKVPPPDDQQRSATPAGAALAAREPLLLTLHHQLTPDTIISVRWPARLSISICIRSHDPTSPYRSSATSRKSTAQQRIGTSSCQFTCFLQDIASTILTGIMSEPDQCIICLDSLPLPRSSGPGLATDSVLQVPPTTTDAENTNNTEDDEAANQLNVVAALDGCEHIIHDACIRSWAQKTNTCPICRNLFHTVRVFNGVDG